MGNKELMSGPSGETRPAAYAPRSIDISGSARQCGGADRSGDAMSDVYTLLVEAGRSPGDGFPDGATGAALLCYAAGRDEAEAVRETVAILKQAEISVLEVSGYGARAEREADGHDLSEEDLALMDRARAENAVIVAQITPFFDE